jgi:transposase
MQNNADIQCPPRNHRSRGCRSFFYLFLKPVLSIILLLICLWFFLTHSHTLPYSNMIVKRKELSAFERGEVIGAWKCGISERKIGEALSHPQSTIHDVISAYKNLGCKTLPSRPGRNPIITERDGRHLLRILKSDRKTNLQELCENFVDSTSTNVCKNTLRKYLHEQGFFGRVGVRKPFVNETNRQKRLTWAKERKEWTSEWENVIWSDESKFELFGGDGKR